MNIILQLQFFTRFYLVEPRSKKPHRNHSRKLHYNQTSEEHLRQQNQKYSCVYLFLTKFACHFSCYWSHKYFLKCKETEYSIPLLPLDVFFLEPHTVLSLSDKLKTSLRIDSSHLPELWFRISFVQSITDQFQKIL